MKRYKIEEKVFNVLMKVATGIILLSLIWILATIVYKGLPYMSWDMVSRTPQGGFYMGKEGGVLNAIVGSLYLAGGSTILALFISLPVVLYLNVYRRKKSAFSTFIRSSLDILWGIPSIVYGAFGFTLMLLFGLKTSLLAGIITLTLLIIPIMIRAMDEVMLTIPKGLFEASYSLGATRFETATKVAIRKTLPGIVTAILISFGRAVGDAASVLFTAGFTDNIPTSLSQPAASLPLAIFFQLGTPVPEVQGRAYASALILTLLILAISLSSRYFTKRYLKNKI
ncbi:MAG: phosphate ABC transporter permease PstA [Cytophagaceae bacterium]|nr:phosphate ABC transporter permease PstA [Cytophagaceae bacterium]